MNRMKKIIYIYVFILVYSSTVIAQSFTGIIQFETENFEAGEKSTITCYIKPSKCKMEIQSIVAEGSTSYTLYFDDQKSDVIMISAGNKLVIPGSSITENKYLQNIWSSNETGRTLNIAGFESKETTLRTNTSIITCYVANELNAVFPNSIYSKGIIQAVRGIQLSGTPVSIEVKDLNGKSLFTQKITSVSSQNLNDNIFSAE